MIKIVQKLTLVFFVSILFKPLWLFEVSSIQPSDDLSYWLHSSTLALDLDLNYKLDHNYKHYTIDPVTNVPYHPPGSGYAIAPFVSLFSIFDKFTFSEFNRLSPVQSFAYIGYFFGNLFYSLWGFKLLKKIVEKKKYNNYSILYFIILLSTVIHFIAGRFLMSHAFEFFICSFILYLYETKKNLFEFKNFSLLSSSYFILSITRPSTFLYTLCLIGVYLESFKLAISLKNKIANFFFLTFLIYSYVNLSQKLYNQSYILLNFSNSQLLKTSSVEFSFDNYFYGLLKFPQLLFSTSMGIFWTMPTVLVFLVILLKPRLYFQNFNIIQYLSIFAYIFVSFSVLFIWQGNEISYGQRLLIGILPFSFIIITKLKKLNLKFFKPHFALLYFSYLYFYSPNLTLEKGFNLWGRVVEFAPTFYSKNLIFNIFNVENIMYVLLKNIFTIDVINLINIKELGFFKYLLNYISLENQIKLYEIVQSYEEINRVYLISITILILVFSSMFVNLALVNKNKIGNE